jgi:hypothetical protein
MRPQVLLVSGAVASMLAMGCAHYPESREQRPVYSYENVEMGPAESGQEYRNDGTVNRDDDGRR